MPPPDELIELAAVVRAHGLRGELLLKPFNPESTLLLELPRVLLKARDGHVSTFEVEEARVHTDAVLIALSGVATREAAEALRGSLVCVTRAELPPLEDGEHYFVDLVGLEARDGQGQRVGTLVEVIDYPAASCFVVESAEGRREVPDLPRYVQQIDVAGGFLVVDHLDELPLEKTKAT